MNPSLRYMTRNVVFFPIYPVLMAIAIPLDTYLSNLAVFVFEDAVRSVIVAILISISLTVLFFVLTRRIHASALLSGTIILVIWAPGLRNFMTLVIMSGPFLAAVAVYIFKNRRAATLVMNVFTIAFFAAPAYSFVENLAWELKHSDGYIPYSQFNKIEIQRESVIDRRPTIVHIVLDGYASDAVLQEIFAHSNEPFSRSLEALGFVVFKHPHTPYSQTTHALASVFSGAYLDANEPPLNLEQSHRLRMAMNNIIIRGPLRRVLQNMDYRFLFTPTGLSGYRYDRSDVVIVPHSSRFRLSHFETFLLSRTALKYLASSMLPTDLEDHYSKAHIALLKNALELVHPREADGPLFIFQHILAPHPPFVIDRVGNLTRRWLANFADGVDGDDATRGLPALQLEYQRGYLEKLRYVNGAVAARVRDVIEKESGPLVVVIHGDHGGGSMYYQNDAERTCFNERFHPYLAVYASDPEVRRLLAASADKPFNLVNLYRVVLDGLFGLDLGRLPDRRFFVSWLTPEVPQDLTDEQLHAPCPQLTALR